MSWMVTGGAGYIGSHVTAQMVDAGMDVVVVDDMSTGVSHRIPDVPFERASLLDVPRMREIVRANRVTGVVHLAGKKHVGESVARPLYYYEENVEGLRRLLSVVQDAGVEKVVFSSSAAVYGNPDVDLVTEATPCRPVNPYGESKLVGEWLLADLARAGMATLALRYFNVAGAAVPRLADTAVANLVTQVFSRLDAGLRPQIYGDDYPTIDGTGVRDYVHVADVAAAHVAAVRALGSGRVRQDVLNIGRGVGVSVRQICQLISDVVGERASALQPEVVARRVGDPARVVASVDRANDVLGWAARYDAAEMVRSAWEGWRALHPTTV